MVISYEEMMDWYKPEPVTDKEKEAIKKISVIEYSIQSNRLQTICEEAKEILTRLGVSEPLQAGDCIVGIYTSNGDMACAVAGTYLHIAAGVIPIKYVIKHFKDDPTVGIKEGDIFFCNEAIYGGIHNPDMMEFLPVFYRGELICWVLAASHEPDTGGIKPGGVIPSAKTRYDEGLKVTPIKIGENFTLRRDVMDLFKNMVRNERAIAVDTAAKATACYKVRERLLELIDQKGSEFLIGLLRMLVNASVETARERIKHLLDGTYRSVVFVDGVGSELSLVRVCCTLHKKADSIKIDFTGCSPPIPYSLNSFPHIVRSVLATILCQYLMCDMPISAGILEPITLHIPENCFLNPPLDSAISGSQFITPQAVRPVHQCLNKAMFGTAFRKYVANPLGAAARVYFYGGMNQIGLDVAGAHASLLNSNGGGARTDRDGIDSCGFWWSGAADSLDIEHEELQYPFVTLFRKFAVDQHGPGKYRGGAGPAGAYIIHDTAHFYIAGGGPNTKFPVEIGLFGGYASGCAPVIDIVKGSDIKELLRRNSERIPFDFHSLASSKAINGEYRFHFLDEGCVISENGLTSMIAIGGAGYGDVLERDPDLVMDDIRKGITSHWAAKNVYRVAYDQETLVVDYKKTDELREKERQDRIKRGKRFEEFEKEWLKKRPPKEALKYYGSWPDGS